MWIYWVVDDAMLMWTNQETIWSEVFRNHFQQVIVAVIVLARQQTSAVSHAGRRRWRNAVMMMQTVETADQSHELNVHNVRDGK